MHRSVLFPDATLRELDLFLKSEKLKRPKSLSSLQIVTPRNTELLKNAIISFDRREKAHYYLTALASCLLLASGYRALAGC